MPSDIFDAVSTFDTPLSSHEEQQFKEWKSRVAPKDSGDDYDFRGAFKAGVGPDSTGHWDDRWKKPNHPTFSTYSIYAKDAPEKAGRWSGDKYIPPNKSKADIFDSVAPKKDIFDQVKPASAVEKRLSDHSAEWNAKQSKMATDAQMAGLPPIPDSRGRLLDAITRSEKAGYPVKHFIGQPNEPTGDRAPTMDIENLVSTLKRREVKDPSVAKERAYWENELAQGTTAQEWKSQTGENDPSYPKQDIFDRVVEFAKKPSPQWLQPFEKAVKSPLLPPQAFPTYWMGKEAEQLGKVIPGTVGKAVQAGGGAIEATADLGSGLSSPANLGLLAVAPEGKAAQAIISGIFLGQAIQGTPEQWKALKSARTIADKVRIGTDMGLSYVLPVAGLAHAATGTSSRASAARPVESSKAPEAVDPVAIAQANQEAAKAVEQVKAPPKLLSGEKQGAVDLPEDAFATVGFTVPVFPGLRQLKTAGQRLNNYRKSFQTLFQTRPTRDKIASSYDAIENQSAITGQQAESAARLAIGGSQMDKQAMTPVIESLGNRSKLIEDATKVVNSSKASPEMKRIYQYATQNFDRLTTKREAIDALHRAQLDSEHLHGINTDEVEGYVAHRYDMDLMTPGKPLILDARGGRGGTSAYFKKQRVFPDYATAIAEGYLPRTLDVTKLVNNRVRAGQTLINQRQWISAMRNEKSPIDGNTLVTDLIRQPKGTFVAPRGYVAREPVNGVRVGVNENFAPLIDALTGVSHVPRVLKNLAGGIKHGVLLWDTFHASRLGQMQSAFMGRIGPTYRKGLSLLEYKDADLDSAVKANEITVEAANYAKANRPTLNRLVKAGLNVGGISDALFKDVVHNVPIAGRYSRWLFDKFNRGVIAESGIYAHERNARLHPEWSDEQLDRATAKEVNTYYRNLRSQGIFKSKTWQDAARVAFLAPQWVEGMVTSELKGYGQMLKVPYDATTKGKLVVGNIAKGMGTGLLAYMASSQLLNLLTRGHPTWDNPEEGQRWSAWIPDFLGSSSGYFLNPMSVFAEMTHDMMKYSESNPNAIDVGTKIASNKFSPLTRAFHDVVMGKDFYGRPLDTVADRVKQAAIDVLPIPIGARSLSQQYAGSQQRTLASSLGFKLDLAPSAVVQINERAKEFNRTHGIKPHESMPSEYRALKAALRGGDMDAAKEEYRKLLKTKSASTVQKYFDRQSHTPFTGSHAREAEFRRSLPREQQEIYAQAQTEEQIQQQRFHQLLH